MPRFFIRADQVINDENGRSFLTITGDDAHHISRSLRMAIGEEITVCDMQRKVYLCKLSRITDTEVEADIVSVSASDTEPTCYIKLWLIQIHSLNLKIIFTTERGLKNMNQKKLMKHQVNLCLEVVIVFIDAKELMMLCNS